MKTNKKEEMKIQKRKKFTSTEDSMIKKLVKIHGTKDWTKISKEIEGRSAKECKGRWINYLSPDITINPSDRNKFKSIMNKCIFQEFNEQLFSKARNSDNISSLFEIDQIKTENKSNSNFKLEVEEESKSLIEVSLNPTIDNQLTSILTIEVMK